MNTENKSKLWYKTWWGILVIIVVLLGLSSLLSSDEETLNTTAEHSASSNGEQELKYEILSQTNNRVSVYTTDKSDENLIRLNDTLFERYKSDKIFLNIDYFDDKEAANGYFDKQMSESISEAEKNKLYTHFIAEMKFNANTGLKQLVKQGDKQRILKTY